MMTTAVRPPVMALVAVLIAWAPVAIAAQAPRFGGTLVVATSSDPGTLNGAITTDLFNYPLLEDGARRSISAIRSVERTLGLTKGT